MVWRHGHAIEPSLQQHLALPPPGVWQAVTPQIFAQLRHPQPAVRGLLLQLLQRVAAAAPFAVLYPALAEVQAEERAGGTPLPELQVRVCFTRTNPGSHTRPAQSRRHGET